jgi:isopropylmalate/homocitrate/citramalate synthase
MAVQKSNTPVEMMEPKASSAEFETVSELPGNDQAMAVYRSWTEEHRAQVERALVRKIDRVCVSFYVSSSKFILL